MLQRQTQVCKLPDCSCVPAKDGVSFAVRFSETRTLSSICGFFFYGVFCSVVLFECLWISSQQEALFPTQCIIVFVLL